MPTQPEGEIVIAIILIVEDRPLDREFLATLLGYGGHHLLEARNGIEGLQLVRAHRPDLVISDIVMPAMDGLEFVRLLRSDPDTARTRVVFYSATFRREEARALAGACGVKDVLEKPSEPQVILAAVASVLGQPIPLFEPLQPGVAEAFTREHVGLLRDKLLEKVRELEAANADLDRRVHERTVELEAANKELEAFSYSVSHDLRAPLRAIDGFSNAVMEEYGPQIPKKAQHYLRSIRAGAQQMGALIDDLLAFSRLSLHALEKRSVATEELARAVWEELSPQREGRQIDFRVGKLPDCEGDPALLKQVWINLFSNALKYSRKRNPAVIEVGVGGTPPAEDAVDSPRDGTQATKSAVTFFIRDNGVGFDMRYANKLFDVFQRLHRAEEYEGTGVGLAIVQRIVHRHGGRVWAEAAVGRGATFYFTL